MEFTLSRALSSQERESRPREGRGRGGQLGGSWHRDTQGRRSKSRGRNASPLPPSIKIVRDTGVLSALDPRAVCLDKEAARQSTGLGRSR